MMLTNQQLTAQIAVEAIVNAYGDGYSGRDMVAVYVHAESVGVSETYLSMLRNLVADTVNA